MKRTVYSEFGGVPFATTPVVQMVRATDGRTTRLELSIRKVNGYIVLNLLRHFTTKPSSTERGGCLMTLRWNLNSELNEVNTAASSLKPQITHFIYRQTSTGHEIEYSCYFSHDTLSEAIEQIISESVFGISHLPYNNY